MTFVHQYSNPEIIFKSAKSFLEAGFPVVYALGVNENGHAVLVKTDLEGEQFWCIQLDGAQPGLIFDELIQIEVNGQSLYIVKAFGPGSLFITCITPDGTCNWVRQIVVNGSNVVARMAQAHQRNNFYLLISRSFGASFTPRVMHLNESGVVLEEFSADVTPGLDASFVLTAFIVRNWGLVIAGTLGALRRTSVVIETDNRLSWGRMEVFEEIRIQDVHGIDELSYVAAGYSFLHGQAIVMTKSISLPSRYYVLPSSIQTVQLCGGSNHFYLVTGAGAVSHVHQFDLQGNPIWSKALGAGGITQSIVSLENNPLMGQLTFTLTGPPLLGLSDESLDTCITSTVATITGQDVTLVPTIHEGFSIAQTTQVITPPNMSVSNLSPTSNVICGEGNGTPLFEWSAYALAQSPHLYLQAAGSTGQDSTAGIHLRWLLKGSLENHLPKGNYSVASGNFNKSNDFVRIYRAAYNPKPAEQVKLDSPTLVEPQQWTYLVGSNAYFLHFLDGNRYEAAKGLFDPQANPAGFLGAYGDGLYEFEHKTRLSFAVTMDFAPVTGNPYVDLELRSVEENTLTAPKVVTLRKRPFLSNLNGVRLFSENIRSVRFRGHDCTPLGFTFEFYDQFITETGTEQWGYVGKYALTLKTPTAYDRLEASPGLVDGNWLRYNDAAMVKAENYREKWSSPSLPPDSRIQNVVSKYIQLSSDANNPLANELIYFNDPNAAPIPGFEPSDNQMELSNLFVLQVAALDYHIARMLGLGKLDVDGSIMNDKWVYLAEYDTQAPLTAGGPANAVQHLYMSLPTATTDQRLPLPINLKAPVPGLVVGADTEAPASLTDANGYSLDGHTRFLSLFHEPLPEEPAGAPFFHSSLEFADADRTMPVYAGIEYRDQGSATWVKPELSFDAAWKNLDNTVPEADKCETRPIVLPDPMYPLFVHRERRSGWHEYSSYGINWFGRAVSSTRIHAIASTLTPTNLMLPPSNVSATLIVAEQPLLLTSATEQVELAGITGVDKTFVRLGFDYNHGQELIDYHRAINGEQVSGYAELPDNEELFAEKIELFFRDEVPNTIAGKIISVNDDSDPRRSVITTGPYIFASMGYDPNTGQPNEAFYPETPSGLAANFAGGVMSVSGQTYIVESVTPGVNPTFIVWKIDADGNAAIGAPSAAGLSAPPVQGMFSAIENMAVSSSWGGSNPFGFKVNCEPSTIHREEVIVRLPDGNYETHVQKFRGVLANATIEAVLEDHDEDELDGIQPTDTPRIHQGIYKLTFNGFSMAEHSQSTGSGHRVEFQKGVVRIATALHPNGPRKELTVLRAEKIGAGADLVLYVADTSFEAGNSSYDAIPIGVASVNYYPGYRVYLKSDAAHGLVKANVLPAAGDDVRYTMFGLRSSDQGLGYTSLMSVPALMFAQNIQEPLAPQLPQGGTYATRPDYFGKSTYSFKVKFDHKPYATQFLRASDIQVLRALYTTDDGGNPAVFTVKRVQEEILLNGADEWLDDRWRNLMGLNYDYPSNPSNNGFFAQFPIGGPALPLPNNPGFISAINDFIDFHNDDLNASVPHITALTSLHQVVIPASALNTALFIKDFLRETIQNCFVPLTEIPVVYKYVQDNSYEPIPKKQVIRDRNGVLLKPTDPDFDMAPMAKIIGPPNAGDELQFTDFNLDGASNAHYFYAVREFNVRMQAGPYSPILGPVHMVHTAPPKSPEVIKVTPVLESRDLGIAPAIELRINAYADVQHIRSLQVYRATNALDARSVRTMKRLPEIDVVAAGYNGQTEWVIQDNFSDLGYVPYGDPLFYVMSVSREVAYEDRNGNLVEDRVPSDPSKLVVTNIVENYNPDAPKLKYYSTPLNAAGELQQVTLVWDKTVHNGTYYLQARNAEGNWIDVKVIQDNADRVVVPLSSISGNSGVLVVKDANGDPIYHHFKVVAENFAKMVSRKDNVLTIHQPSVWQDISTL